MFPGGNPKVSHLQHQIQSSVDVDLLWKTLTDSRWVRKGGARKRVPAFGGCFYLFLLQVEGQSVESDAVLPVSLVTEHRQQDSLLVKQPQKQNVCILHIWRPQLCHGKCIILVLV